MGTTSKGAPYPDGTDLVREGDNAIKALAEWASNEFVKSGRVDRTIEGNGALRLTPAECWFDNAPPRAIHGTGIHEGFAFITWSGFSDGGGSLVEVWAYNGVKQAPGNQVAIFYTAYR